MAYRGLGWKKSPPDSRDYKLKMVAVALPTEVDLRATGYLPSIWDQGNLGSCTAHGAGEAFSYDLEKQGGSDDYMPSRLYIYYNTRVLEGTESEDSGAYTRDAIKSLNKTGAPPETDWPYDIDKFAVKPSSQAYQDGGLREAVKYARVDQTVSQMKAVLASGYPFVVGFTVYESFESDQANSTGVIPFPDVDNEEVLGGHCVLVVGYKLINNEPYWICQNSWGTGWGDNGYFYMPEKYLTDNNLADDFWVLYQVSSPDPGPVNPPDPTPPEPSPVPVDKTFIEELIAMLNKIVDWLKSLL